MTIPYTLWEGKKASEGEDVIDWRGCERFGAGRGRQKEAGNGAENP